MSPHGRGEDRVALIQLGRCATLSSYGRSSYRASGDRNLFAGKSHAGPIVMGQTAGKSWPGRRFHGVYDDSAVGCERGPGRVAGATILNRILVRRFLVKDANQVT